jgi:TRAP-type C4-dicarboxylate transport system substrate-binding protein
MARGKIRVEDRWGATVHSDREGVAALRDGRSHLAPIYSAWDRAAYPLAQALQLPGLFPDSETATAVSEQLYAKYFRADVECQGILMGRMKASGAYHLFSMSPIRRLEDLTGARVGTTEGIEADVMRALGAEPVALSSLEMRPALESGRIDAMHLSDGSAEVFGIGFMARFRTQLGMVRQNLEFGMSTAFWTSLPPDLQRVVAAWLRAEAQAETQIFYGVAGARARERFAASGMQFIRLAQDEYSRWSDRAQRVIEDFVRTEEAAGRPALALLADIAALNESHRGKSADELMREAIFRL